MQPDALHGSVEWYAEHKVHPKQDTWISMRVYSAREAREWLDRMAQSGATEVRIVRKEVFVLEGRRIARELATLGLGDDHAA